MDLNVFIATTLLSIKKGVKKANTEDSTFIIYNEPKVINFDVAVEVGKENMTEKGGGLTVKVVEGKIGSQAKSKESNISRINFTVGVKTTIQ